MQSDLGAAMAHGSSIRDLFNRYLRLLGINRSEPTIAALRELVSAQVMRVPFETVSKLLRRKRCKSHPFPDLVEHLDGIEHHNFGGTCYSNNYYFHLLLDHLGYDVALCGADMSNPDVHVVNIVKVDGGEYIVDGGYAAPFMEPMPRDLDHDFEITLGRDRYVLQSQDSDGCSKLEMFRDGEVRHGYRVKPIPRTIDHFDGAIAQSFTDEATFMNALLLVRFFPDRSIAVNNLTVIESEGCDFKIHHLTNKDDLPAVINRYFGMPNELVSEALTELRGLGNAWN